MARARSIKPGFFKNEELCSLSPLARLLFAGLWTIADRAGRLEDRPKRIKAEIFPYDNVNCDKLLNDLAGAGFIIRYEAGETRAISIPSWNKHQNPHVKEVASTISAPGLHQTSTVPVPENPERAGLVLDSLLPEPCNLNPEPGNVNPEPGARPAPLEVSIPNFGEEFEGVIGAFLAAGVSLSQPQILMAAQEWEQIPPEERAAVVECARARARKNEARFMGLPHSWFRKAEWRARGPGRLLPEPRAQTKAEIGQEEAAKRFMRGREHVGSESSH